MDDAELLDRARRGDDAAFTQLFGRHQRGIYRYAAHMCGRDAADDVVQETFLVVLRGVHRYDPERSPVAGYLFGIARHDLGHEWSRAAVLNALGSGAGDVFARLVASPQLRDTRGAGRVGQVPEKRLSCRVMTRRASR